MQTIIAIQAMMESFEGLIWNYELNIKDFQLWKLSNTEYPVLHCIGIFILILLNVAMVQSELQNVNPFTRSNTPVQILPQWKRLNCGFFGT